MLLWNSHSYDGLAWGLALLASLACLGLAWGGLKTLGGHEADAFSRVLRVVMGVGLLGAALLAGLVVAFCLSWVASP